MDPCKNQSAHPHEAVEAPRDCLAVGCSSAPLSPAMPDDSDWRHTMSASDATSPACNLFHTKPFPLGWEAIICNRNPFQPSEVRYEHHNRWCSPTCGIFPWTSTGKCWKTPPCFSVPGPPCLSHQEWKRASYCHKATGRCCSTARSIRPSTRECKWLRAGRAARGRTGSGDALGEKADCRKMLFQAVWTKHEKWN